MTGVALALALVLVALWGGAGTQPRLGAAEAFQPAPAPHEVPPSAETQQILHLLSQATYGPRPGDVARVQAIGARAWLEQQLAPQRLDDRLVAAKLATLRSLTLPIAAALRDYPRPSRDLREKLKSGERTRERAMLMYPMDRRPSRMVAELQAAKAVRAVESERQLEFQRR